jgi:Acetyltransferase (GNAT) domain
MDREEWEELVDRAPVPPGLFQRFDFSLVDAQEGLSSRFLAVRTPEGRLVGGARITIEKRLPARHVEMPGGPILLPGFEDEGRALISKQLLEQVLVVDSGLILPAPGYPWHLDDFGMHRSEVPLETSIVDLTRTEDQLWHSVDRSVRQGVRKATEHGLTVREVTDEREIEQIYPLIDRFGRVRDFEPISKSRLLATQRVFHPAGRMHILVCEAGATPAGVSIILLANQRAELLVVASAPEFQKLQSTTLLDWESFRFSKAHGATSLDFLGLPPAGSGREGIRRFKLKWGGVVVAQEEYLEGVFFRVAVNFVRRWPSLFNPIILGRGPFRQGIR